MSDQMWVRGNDWGVLAPPSLGDWQPTRTVSVIIPAYGCQDYVDLALAALARQTYPAHLLEVVVADDGSAPKIELPELAPEHTRAVRVPDVSTGWGRSNALHAGAMASDGEILHWLDADLVAFPRHVEAQARWHHVTGDAVTMGYKRFVSSGPWPAPAEVADGPVESLFDVERTEPHEYVEELIDASDGLRAADHLAFRAHVGATAALTRDLYLAAGGLDTDLRLGEDSEFGYRLAQAGAVFVPEPAAGSWHLGPSNMMRDGDALRRYNRPFLADRMAHPRWLRTGSPGRGWRVPLVTAVVPADGPLEQVRECVDRLLAGDERDLTVLLVGDWDALTDQRRRVLDDPRLDLRLLAATYRSDPRVRLVDRAPETAFPSPYRLTVPAHLGVGRQTVRRLVELADERRAGLLRIRPPGVGPDAPGVEPEVPGVEPDAPRGTGTGGGWTPLELWRTAAESRARRSLPADSPGGPLVDAVDAVWGVCPVDGVELGVVLSGTAATSRGDGPVDPPAAVPVAGVRSLVRATGYVAKLAAARARQRLQRRLGATRAGASIANPVRPRAPGRNVMDRSGPP